MDVTCKALARSHIDVKMLADTTLCTLLTVMATSLLMMTVVQYALTIGL